MAAGCCSCITGKAKGIKDRSQGYYGHEKKCQVEIPKQWCSRGMAVNMRNQTQGNGADGDADSHAQLHDGAEKSICPAHPIVWDLGIGKRRHAGEFQRTRGAMEEQDCGNQDRGRARYRAAQSAIEMESITPFTMMIFRNPKRRRSRITKAFMLRSPANSVRRYRPERKALDRTQSET